MTKIPEIVNSDFSYLKQACFCLISPASPYSTAIRQLYSVNLPLMGLKPNTEYKAMAPEMPFLKKKKDRFQTQVGNPSKRTALTLLKTSM